MFKVEVIYALPNEQKLIQIEVAEGTTIEQAIEASKILNLYPEIDLSQCEVGVFSQRQKLDYVLHPNDRIEIYRELIADPKEVRRRRAQEQREQGLIK